MVILIVAILGVVALPVYRGKVDNAKWSEGRAAAGTIATAIRAYISEKGSAAIETPDFQTDLGFGADELNGTYFLQACYEVSNVTCSTDGKIGFKNYS